MSKKVLIMTGTTDCLREKQISLPDHMKFFQEESASSDPSMEEVFDITLPSKIRYAKKHRYDILTMRSFGEEPSCNFLRHHIGFLRALRAFQMLSLYDVVMWVDADAVVTKENMPVEDFGLSSEHSLYVSWDWQWKQSFSTGNFILQRAPKTNDLFRTFLEVSQNFLSGFGEEQKTLNFIYRNTPLSSAIKILDHSYLNSVPKAAENTEVWRGRPPVLYPWDEFSFLAHITGMDNRNRIEILKKHFSENL